MQIFKLSLKAALCGVVCALSFVLVIGSVWLFYQELEDGKIGAIQYGDYVWVIKVVFVLGFLLGTVSWLDYETSLGDDPYQIMKRGDPRVFK